MITCPVSLMQLAAPTSTLFPYTTLFRSRWKTNVVGWNIAAENFWWGVGMGDVRDEMTLKFLQEEGVYSEHYPRSEEHTSELQSRFDLVCRLLLEKKHRIQKYH